MNRKRVNVAAGYSLAVSILGFVSIIDILFFDSVQQWYFQLSLVLLAGIGILTITYFTSYSIFTKYCSYTVGLTFIIITVLEVCIRYFNQDVREVVLNEAIVFTLLSTVTTIIIFKFASSVNKTYRLNNSFEP